MRTRSIVLFAFMLLIFTTNSYGYLDGVSVFNENYRNANNFSVEIESKETVEGISLQAQIVGDGEIVFSSQESINEQERNTSRFNHHLEYDQISIVIRYLLGGAEVERHEIDVSEINSHPLGHKSLVLNLVNGTYRRAIRDIPALNVPIYSTSANEQSMNMRVDTMTVRDYDKSDHDCGDGPEPYENDDNNRDRVGIFAISLGSIGSNKVITQAIAHIYADEVAYDISGKNADGDFWCFTSVGNDYSTCDTCMDYYDYSSCNTGGPRFFDVFAREEDYVDREITANVLSEARQAYKKSHKYMFLICRANADSDDYARATFHSEGSSSYAPYLEITYQDQDCTPGSGPCCDDLGLFRPTSHKCSDNVQQQLSCHWGDGRSSNVGKQHYDQFCSGTAASCSGALELDNEWVVHQDCSDDQKCQNNVCVDVPCFTNNDCGVNGWVNNPFCSSNDVYDMQRAYTCNRAGETNSYCSYDDTPTRKRDCGENFYWGWNGNYCTDLEGDVEHSRAALFRGCSNGACYSTTGTDEEIVEDCQYGCKTIGGTPQCAFPECSYSGQCGSNRFEGEQFCSGVDLYQTYRIYSCDNANTIHASCSSRTESRKVRDCQYGCLVQSGHDVCDPNGPPSTTSLTSNTNTIQRTQSVTITCRGSDPNGANDIVSADIQYFDPNQPESRKYFDFLWNSLSTQRSGSGIFSATFTPSAGQPVKPYDFRCRLRDNGGRESAWIEQNDMVSVTDYTSVFTIPVQDHTTESSPATAGDNIVFTTNIYDPDSDVQLTICDADGRDGSVCKGNTYCTDGFKNHGSFSCSYSSTNLGTDSYAWISFVTNNNGEVVDGDSGDFHVINQPRNPRVTLAGQEIWSSSGLFSGTSTISSFNTQLTSAIGSCIPDQNGFCLIPLEFFSDSGGFFDIDQLRVTHTLLENLAPQLYALEDITINEGDLFEMIPKGYDPNGDTLAFTISDPVGNDGVWQTGEDDDGTHQITVTVSDGEHEDTLTFNLIVRELLDPDRGGVVNNGPLEMVVPPNSLPPNQFVDVTVEEVDETHFIMENNLKLVSSVYSFSPPGIIFDPPIEITYGYDESQVDDEDNLDAFYYKLIDQENEVYRWVPLGATVDKDANTLTFYLTHFSEYSIQETVTGSQAPSITINYPQSTDYTSVTNPVDIRITDDSSASINVTFYLNQENTGDMVYENGALRAPDGVTYTVSPRDLSSLQSGEHNLTLIATDSDNNWSTATVEFRIVDLVPPSTSIESSAGSSGNWSNESVTIEFNVSDDAQATTYYCIDQFNSCQPNIEGDSATVSDNGIYYVRYRSVDPENQESIQSQIVQVDTELPQTNISITSEHVNDIIDANLSAEDEFSGINATFYRLEDSEGNVGTWQKGDSFTLNEEAIYTIQYYSVDNAANVEAVHLHSLTLDFRSPQSTLADDNEWYANGESITITCSDSGDSGCDYVQYSIEDGEASSSARALNPTLQLACDQEEVCTQELEYQSVDRARNIEPLRTKTLNIDNQNPNITLHEEIDSVYVVHLPQEVFSKELVINYSVDDGAGSGIADVNATIDGNITQEDVSLNLTELGEGIHELVITALDSVGNVQTTTRTFTIVFNTAPSIELNVDQSMLEFTEDAGVIASVINIHDYISDAESSDNMLSLEIHSQSAPNIVSCSIENNQSLNCSTAENMFGSSTVGITVIDEYGLSDSDELTVVISSVNDIPIALNDSLFIEEDNTATIDVLLNDSDVEGDVFLSQIVTSPSHGSAQIVGEGIQYTPSLDYVGEDVLAYEVLDEEGASDIGYVIITISALNDAPRVSNDHFIVMEDNLLSITLIEDGVLANDSDVESNSMRAILVTQPSNGRLTLYPNGTFEYLPSEHFNGDDSFTYLVDDDIYETTSLNQHQNAHPQNDPLQFNNQFFALEQSEVATVTITVTPFNDPPLAADDYVDVEEDNSVAINVLLNDSDIEGGVYLQNIQIQPENGVATISGEVITYTPNTNFFGEDNFTYSVTDDQGETDSAVVRISIAPVNDLPTAIEDSYTLEEDTILVVPDTGPLFNDSDAENDPLTMQKVDDVDHGELVWYENGSFTYQPTPDYFGNDSFSYVANDGENDSYPVRVNFTIIDMPDSGPPSGNGGQGSSTSRGRRRTVSVHGTVPADAQASATTLINNVEANELIQVRIDNPNIALRGLDVVARTDITNAEITVSSQQIPLQQVTGDVYQYVDVTSTPGLVESIEPGGVVSFGVEKSWFTQNLYSEVELLSYVGERWVPLVTTIVHQDASSVYYEALTPDIEHFAIVAHPRFGEGYLAPLLKAPPNLPSITDISVIVSDNAVSSTRNELVWSGIEWPSHFSSSFSSSVPNNAVDTVNQQEVHARFNEGISPLGFMVIIAILVLIIAVGSFIFERN